MCETSQIRVLLLLLSSQAVLCVGAWPHRFTALASGSSMTGMMEQTQQGAAPAGAAEIFASGKRALQRGELTEAENCFRRVIGMDPSSAAAHTNLAVVYMRERRWDDALGELRRARTLRPGDAGVTLDMGLAYYRKGDFVSAIEPFRRSLEEAPGSLQARYLLGLCYFFTSDYKMATATLVPLWDSEMDHLNYLYVLSIAASKVADATVQKKAFERMLVVGKDTPEFHLYLGKAWLAEEDMEKALEEFKAAASAQPTLPLVHYFLGRTYFGQRHYELATEELLRDITIEPDFAYNYEELGILSAQMDKTTKAEEYFDRALERNAYLVNSCFGLAKIYRATGRYKEALAMLDRAETMAPQSASLHYTKGQVLARMGEAEKARQEFARSAELLHAFNDRLQQGAGGDIAADAQGVAEQ